MRSVSLFALCASLIFWQFSSVEAKGPRQKGVIATLDFQDLEQQTTDAPTHEPVYPGLQGRNPADPFAADACLQNAESCFLLVARHWSSSANPPDFKTAGTLRAEYPGSTALFHGRTQGEIVLTRTDGGTFDFLQIDLAEWPGGDGSGGVILSGPFDINFYGIKSNGKTVTATATLANTILALERFEVRGFDDLVSLSWFQAPGEIGPAHQFDNVALRVR